jgi:chemotaxis protein MotB
MAANVAPIIIIKRKKKGHAAHHGGAWKVAYADFVTAMMAFFLLLWLLNSTTQEQRSGISEYFNAASASRNTSGVGKILGGATITLDGPSKGKGAPIGLPIPTPEKNTEKTDAESEDKVNAGAKDERAKDPDNAGKNKELPTDDMSEAQMKEVMRKREDKVFEKAEKAIKRAVETTPGLRRLSENLVVERTAEGLRIQIIDQDKTSMFASGSSVPYQHARQLLGVIAQVIAKMPNKVSLSGHTDGTPYARGASYTNWELSTDRAHAARRLLIRYGLKSTRLRRVVGRAGTEHLIKSDPTSPRNRRLSITLLRQDGTPPKVGTSPPAQRIKSLSPAPVLAPPTPELAPATPNLTPPPPVASDDGRLILSPPKGARKAPQRR